MATGLPEGDELAFLQSLGDLVPEEMLTTEARVPHTSDEARLFDRLPSFDLDAAAEVGFPTALVRRPAEWGDNPSERPAMPPHGTYDIEVDSIAELSGEISKVFQASFGSV